MPGFAFLPFSSEDFKDVNRILLTADDLEHVRLRYLFYAGRGYTIVGGSQDVGRCLACEGNPGGWSWGGLSLCGQPGINSMLESPPCSVIGDRLAIRKTK